MSAGHEVQICFWPVTLPFDPLLQFSSAVQKPVHTGCWARQSRSDMFEFASGWELLSAFLQIVLINIVLSGDNAVVIALACRSLPPRQQKLALVLGGAGVIVLMTGLTAFAAYLLTLPYIEIAGSLVLLWIGTKLLLPQDQAEDGAVKEGRHLADAIRTVIVADIVMSLDNVLGMAAAAKGHLAMLVLGLVITIPVILFCSALIMKLMQRFSILVTLGGALLGYVAGEMAIGDPSIRDWVARRASYLNIIVPLVAALLVVVLGKALGSRRVDTSEKPSDYAPKSTDKEQL